MRGWLLLVAALSAMSATLATGVKLVASKSRTPEVQTAGAPIDPEAGTSETLARDRATRISGLRYDVAFSVPADRQAPITGRETITFDLGSASKPLAVDFDPHRATAVHAITVNGAPDPTRALNGHLLFPASVLQRGENRITIAFDAGDVPLNRSDDVLYTIFVPARAHEAFPCFDQPDLKARWTLSLEVPEGWEAVSNGAASVREARDGRTRIGFAETPPISAYLFA